MYWLRGRGWKRVVRADTGFGGFQPDRPLLFIAIFALFASDRRAAAARADDCKRAANVSHVSRFARSASHRANL